MMKFKKFLAAAMTGAMMLGMVATAAPAVSAQAGTITKLGTSDTMIFHAAATDPETVTKSGISYKKMTLTIESNDPYVVVEFYKDFTKKDKASNTYTYAAKNNVVVVDLGFFKPTKQAGIRYYGSSLTDEEKKAIEIQPINVQAEKFSVKVDASKDTFAEATVEKSKNFKLTSENIDQYSYRSLYATEWEKLSKFDFNFNTAKVAGTTIVIRKDATAENPASPEVKVKISASAKAPKVSIDYVKGTIKGISEKQEIALLQGTAIEKFEKKATKNMTVEALAGEIGGNTTQGFTVVIRTNDGKKAPSMPTLLEVKPAPVLTGESQTISGASIQCLATTSGSSITVTGTTKRNKTEVEFTVKNEGETKYEYEYSLDGKTGWKKVTTKSVSINGNKVWVRTAGVKEPKKDTDPAPRFSSNGVELTVPIVEQNQ